MKTYTVADTIYLWGDSKMIAQVIQAQLSLVLSMGIEQIEDHHLAQREVLRDALLEVCEGHTNELQNVIHGHGGAGCLRLTNKGRIQVGRRNGDTGKVTWFEHPWVAKHRKELLKRLRAMKKAEAQKEKTEAQKEAWNAAHYPLTWNG